jgi:hypothetical protein
MISPACTESRAVCKKPARVFCNEVMVPDLQWTANQEPFNLPLVLMAAMKTLHIGFGAPVRLLHCDNTVDAPG